MRPARKGPENVRDGLVPSAMSRASMRPARKGPENIHIDFPARPGRELLQ